MLARQEYDGTSFLKKAKEANAKLKVVTDARVVPRSDGDGVVMTPVVLLHYILTIDEAKGQPQRLIYEELIDDLPGGALKLEGSLFKKIIDDHVKLDIVDPLMMLPRRAS